MTCKPFGLGVRALIRDDEGRILVLRRVGGCRHFPGQWDLPGGKVESGEDFEGALHRETEEETGLSIRVERFAGAGEYELPKVRAVTLFFDARMAGGPLRLSDEHELHQWATPDQVLAIDLAPVVMVPLAQVLRAARQVGA